MIVHVIHCNYRHSTATTITTDDEDVFVIIVNKNLSYDTLRNQLRHELMHIVNGDFHRPCEATQIEQEARQYNVSDADLDAINFYHHFLDNTDNVV